ncbi:MAG: hypothetical protein ACT4PZ_08730 [Panacagrimonas sp.]
MTAGPRSSGENAAMRRLPIGKPRHLDRLIGRPPFTDDAVQIDQKRFVAHGRPSRRDRLDSVPTSSSNETSEIDIA